MSREEQVAALLLADSALLAVLTGGIYVYGELYPEGLTRETTPAAFDSSNGGFLLPCAIVKQRGEIPSLQVDDPAKQVMSANQVVEIWLYQDATYSAIDAAKPLIYHLLQGKNFDDSFELYLAMTVSRQRDSGALQDASMERMDFAIPFLLGIE